MRTFYQTLTLLLCTWIVTPSMAQLSVSFNITNPTCSNYTNGQAVASTTGGAGPYFYSWSNGQTGPTSAGLGGGSYTVTVTSQNGQTTTAVAVVVPPPVLDASVLQGGAICNPDGSASAAVTGGTGAYTYLWTTGATTATIFQPMPHAPCVTVTDGNGCVDVSCSKIFKPLETAFVVNSEANCATQQGGSINANVIGGYGPYNYVWNTGSTLSFVSNGAPGTYTATVTDFNGCTATGSATITAINSTVNVNASATATACPLVNSGSASASGAGGVGSISYQWSNGASTAVTNNLAAGTYTVTAVDDFGCTGSASVVVDGSNLSVTTALNENTTCTGTTGFAQAIGAGGAGSYSFAWSNGANTASNTNLGAGTYTVTITDAVGCTNISSVTVGTNVIGLDISLNTTQPVCGGLTGHIFTGVSNGTAPFSYLWSTGAISESLIGVVAGSYTVTITDANGCTGQSSTEINPSTPLSFSQVTAPTGCPEVNSGTATVFNVIGTPDFTYSWSTGATLSGITNLAAGNYTVTVTDNAGCTASAVLVVGTAPAMDLSLFTENADCGINNGTVNVDVENGIFPWSYVWSNGASTQSITLLGPGTYTVTVTDNVGCTAVASSVVDQDPAFTYTVNTTPVSCNGGSDGTATVENLSGAGPYNYVWSNGTTGTNQINGLAPGIYTVTVADNFLCQSIQSFSIGEPAVITVLFANLSAVTCDGGLGGATAIALGGASPYTYAWSNGDDDNVLSVSTGGLYTVTATDNNGCEGVFQIEIQTEGGPTVIITAPTTELSCQNLTIPATVSGADTYVWNFGSTLETVIISEPGTYTVTATQTGNTCTSVAQITFTQIDNAPNVTIEASTPSILNCINTEVVLTAQTEVGNTLQWMNDAVTATIIATEAGVYSVTVTDPVTNCTAVDTYELAIDITQPNLEINSPVINCATPSALVIASSTVAGASFEWDNGTVSPIFSTTNPGTYTVTVTNPANGCTNVGSVTVIEDFTEPTVGLLVPDGLELNCIVTSLDLGATGGVSYEWSTGSDQSEINVSEPGDYTVTVTGGNGCTATGVFAVSQTSVPPVAQISALQNPINCLVTTTEITATGGGTYEWSTSAILETIVVGVGTYTVTVTADNGCTDVESITITQTPAPSVNIEITSDNQAITCVDLTVDLLASSTTPDATFVWSNGDVTAATSVSAAGNYTVTVTDPATGCTSSSVINVGEDTNPPGGQIQPFNAQIDCNNPGPIDLTINSGVSYLWDNGSTDNTISVSPTATTTYTVTVTGDNGCTDVKTRTVQVNLQAPTAGINAPQATVNCLDGTANLQGTGAGPNGDYDWSTGSNNNAINVSPTVTTTYTVTVTGQNGCTATSSVTIAADFVEPNATIGNPSGTITCANPGPVTITAAGGGTYNWNNGTTTALNSVNPTVTTTYTVTVTAANGCTDTATQTVIADQTPPTAQIATPDGTTITCNNPGPLALNATGGGTYEWDPSGETAANISVNPAANSTYTVTVTAANGCTDVETVSVNILGGPSVTATATPSTIQLGGTSTLDVTDVTNATYEWSPVDSLDNENLQSPVANPSATTTYVVTVTDENGCTATASVTVTVQNQQCSGPNIFIPNSFSPNADNTNDRYLIRGDNMLYAKLVVYNRWGQKVYSEEVTGNTPVQMLGWDGRFEGELVAPDVYGWYLEVRCTGGGTYTDKGNVSVFR